MVSATHQHFEHRVACLRRNMPNCLLTARWLCLSQAFVASCFRLSVALGCVLWFAMSVGSPTLHAQTYTDLHDFDCSNEGCEPAYPAVLSQGRNGRLYGTAKVGGTSGLGTVFQITPSGTIKTLHNFSGADGSNPTSGLTLGTDGNFYGTTHSGGANNFGTIFKMTPAGVLTTLHSFTGGDGASPFGAPVQGKNGSFYGTTCGFNAPWTGYSITAGGNFKVLTESIPPCSFAPLIVGSDGNFYGTSQAGGLTYQGTAFRMTPNGTVTILYNFDYTHGAYLYSPLVQGNDGFLYGTTSGGGSGNGGVVFKLSTHGKLTLLHQFDDNSTTDGAVPFAGLVAATDGNYYGATSGGLNSGSVPNGNLFDVSSKGSYSLLYAFDAIHGALAQATPMQHTNGKIYGVTERGGGPNGSRNEGVVYDLGMNLQPFVFLVTRWGAVGQTVEILGGGLTGTTSVKFGSVSANFTVVSDTYMTAVAPVGGATDFVTVTTPTSKFTSSRPFIFGRAILTLNPTSGKVGDAVKITGTSFTGATKVAFGGVKATTFTVDSDSQITATVPTGAVTGKIQVTTPGGTATATSKRVFTVIQ